MGVTSSELSTPVVASFEGIVRDVLAGRLDAPSVRDGLLSLFPPPDPADDETRVDPPAQRIQALVWHGDAVVVVEADHAPEMNVEDESAVTMERVPGTDLWIRAVRVAEGRAVNYGLRIDGRPIGAGISPHSIAGYPPLSHPLPDAPAGVLSERRTLSSSIYDDAEIEYWTYTNAGIDLDRGAPLMVWLDGRGFIGAGDAVGIRLQTVTDNLVHRGLIPPMVHLLLSSPRGGTRDIPADHFHTGVFDFRTQAFDEVSEELNRHLLEEVLPHVERDVRIRRDGYSRGIFGASSGGTAAFKVGWYAPDQFSRLYPYLASFDAWGWRPGEGIDGGQVLPLWVRRGPRRNLRVWLSAGRYDDFDEPMPAHLAIEPLPDGPFREALHRAGSQALGQFEMAQALKTSGYDFHFRYGDTGHNFAQAASELPESLAWLWRDYDPDRTEQAYEPDEPERAQPVYRFGVINRDTW
jgi:enterochelin esterase family protein